MDKATQELKRSTMLLPMKSHGTALPRLLLKHQHRDQVIEHMEPSNLLIDSQDVSLSVNGVACCWAAVFGFHFFVSIFMFSF